MPTQNAGIHGFHFSMPNPRAERAIVLAAETTLVELGTDVGGTRAAMPPSGVLGQLRGVRNGRLVRSTPFPSVSLQLRTVHSRDSMHRLQ
jgi:hypothetical protein